MAVDAEGIVRKWINDNAALSGLGNPLTRGAHFKRSKSEGTYAFIIGVGTPPDLTAECPIGRARISATIHARTKQASSNAAVAYMTQLEGLNGAPQRAGDFIILVVDNITGPLPLDDHLTTREEFRYLVDADFYIRAV